MKQVDISDVFLTDHTLWILIKIQLTFERIFEQKHPKR
jgi:hypothetical protein